MNVEYKVKFEADTKKEAEKKVNQFREEAGDWKQFSREIDLFNQRAILRNCHASLHQGRAEKAPGNDTNQDKHGVLSRGVPAAQDREDDRKDEHQPEWIEQAPQNAQDRVFVTGLDVTDDQAL